MDLKLDIRRYAAIPLRHVGFAIASGTVIAAAFWLQSALIPTEFISSALLSYQVPHEFLAEAPRQEAPTIRIAESVLDPAILRTLADQVHFDPSAAHSRLSRPDDKLTGFRSHFELEQPAPGLLQVSYRGTDQKQVLAATNALAGALAAWVAKPAPAIAEAPAPPLRKNSVSSHAPGAARPATATPVLAGAAAPSEATARTAQIVRKEPTAADKRKAADLQHRAATIDENLATLALQQQNIETRILARITEEKSLERGRSKSTVAAAPDAAPGNAASDTRARLAAIDKDLVTLRTLRSTVVQEENSEKEQAQGLKSRAAALLVTPLVTAAAAQPEAPQPVTQVAAAPVAAAIPHTEDPPRVKEPLADPDSTQQDSAQQGQTQQPSWQGAFTVLTWGETPHPLSDDTRQILQWGGLAAGFLVLVAYLVLTGWRFRPVSNPASLRSVLPQGIKYFGAVAGSPLLGSSIASASLPGGSITEKSL